MLPLWSLILGWLLTAITVVGNGLVIYLITARRNLRTTTNWFVLSLALADFGVGITFFPRFSFCLIDDPSCVNHAVIIAYSTGYSLIFASVTNLCALTLDRYLAIVKPLRYVTFMTEKRVALMIFAAWSVAFLVLVSFLVLLLATSGTTQDIMAKYVALCLTLLSIFVCVSILFVTVRIFLIARKHSRQTAAMIAQLNYNHRIEHGRWKSQDAAATNMVGTVVAVFVVSYSLDIYVNICFYGGQCQPPEIIDVLNALTLLMNSAVNPIAYAFFKREIRRELKHLFRCKRQRSPTSGSFNIQREQREQYLLTLQKNRAVDQRPEL